MKPDDTLERLIADWLGDTISPEDFRALEARLCADPAARAALRRAARLDASLRAWAAAHEISAAWTGADARVAQPTPPPPASVTTRFRRWLWPLAAAAAIALSIATYHFGTLAAPQPIDPGTRVLADGTVVELNGAAEITPDFTPGERRVRLDRGEAHFIVTKDPTRPFTVSAGGVTVRAVGTAFNVQLQSAAVDVLVTEGTVQLGAAAEPAPAFARVAREPIPLLRPGHRAVVSLAPVTPATAVVVTTATADEISRTLAWQAPLLRLGGATLAEVAREFERRTGRRVVFADPEIAALRLGGRFRADDLDGFTHLLATTFDLAVEPAADHSLVLRKKTSGSR